VQKQERTNRTSLKQIDTT